MRDYLRHLKRDLNIPQNDIYEILTDIRSEVKSDDFDNFVLEVMDLASGWRPEHFFGGEIVKTAYKDGYLLRKPNSMNKSSLHVGKTNAGYFGNREKSICHSLDFFNLLNTENSRSESGWISKCQINVF